MSINYKQNYRLEMCGLWLTLSGELHPWKSRDKKMHRLRGGGVQCGGGAYKNLTKYGTR